MDWKKEIEIGQQLTRDRKFEEAADKYKEILAASEEEPSVHFWAMKHLADIIGFLYAKDYLAAIDLYQNIINEYEGEDGLYEWCQVDMAKCYLLAGISMLESYENMTEFLEPLNEDMAKYIEKIQEQKEDFIVARAESIYKARL